VLLVTVLVVVWLLLLLLLLPGSSALGIAEVLAESTESLSNCLLKSWPPGNEP